MLKHNLNDSNFATLFGTSCGAINTSVKNLIDSLDFRYRIIVGEELEALLLDVLKRIDLDTQIVGAEDRREVWDRGWRENLEDFRTNQPSEASLVPKFIRNGNPLRLFRSYVASEDPAFELNFVKVLRAWMFNEYFREISDIYEFGCGTGFNLVALSDLYPEKTLFGSDFVSSSVDLVNEIASRKNISLSGFLFDMKNPDSSYLLRPNSGVFTFGALEQLAGSVDQFFNYLLSQSPKICIHIEPDESLYNSSNLYDYLALRFQNKRGYTGGLSKKLIVLEEQKKISVIKSIRVPFGSLMMEGYNIFVWQPWGN
jgi:hypothetical protein